MIMNAGERKHAADKKKRIMELHGKGLSNEIISIRIAMSRKYVVDIIRAEKKKLLDKQVD